MRTEQEIKEMFEAMIAQRDKCEKHSTAYDILNYRLQALAWVRGHAKVKTLCIAGPALSMLNCVH